MSAPSPIPLRPDAGAMRAAAVTSLARAAIATGLQQQWFIVRDGKGQALTYVYFEDAGCRQIVRNARRSGQGSKREASGRAFSVKAESDAAGERSSVSGLYPWSH
jgi:hypothetical protein